MKAIQVSNLRSYPVIIRAIIVASVIAFPSIALAAPIPKETKKGQLQLLEGKWASISCDYGDGQQPEKGEFSSLVLVIENGKIGMRSRDTVIFDNRKIDFDFSQSLCHMDISKGLIGIVKTVDDKLYWRTAPRGENRPADFSGSQACPCSIWTRVAK